MLYEYNQYSFFGNFLLNKLYKKDGQISIKTAKRYLNSLLKDMNLEMHITWNTEDVLKVVQKYFVKDKSQLSEYNISEEDAKTVLEYTYNTYNPKIGVSYKILALNISKLIKQGKIIINN